MSDGLTDSMDDDRRPRTRVVVDRGITHEWVRHRIGAYTQESTRFVIYEKKMPASFVMPVFTGQFAETQREIWGKAIAEAEHSYRALVQGTACPPQIARSVFPNALASRLVITYNLRNWRHFFLLRTTREAHPQMRQVTIPLLQEFQSKIPILFDDIEPESSQAENVRKSR